MHTNFRWRIDAVISCGFCIALVGSAEAQGDRQDSLALVRKHAERRSSIAQPLRVTFTERTTLTAHGRKSQAALQDVSIAAEAVEDSKDAGGKVESEKQWVVTLADNRFRFEQSGTVPGSQSEVLQPFLRTSVYNGRWQTALTVPFIETGFFQGILTDQNRDVEYLAVKPLLWHTRLLDTEWVSAQQPRWVDRNQVGDINGSECRVIGVPGSTESYWFDPAQDWCLRRYRMEAGGIEHDSEVPLNVDVEYVADDLLGFRPKSWVIRTLSRGTPHSETRVEVTAWDWIESVEDDTFELEFPRRTFIDDRRDSGRRYAVIDAQGREVEITRDDVAAGRLTRIMDGTEDRPPPHSASPRRRLWWVVGANLALLTMLAVVVLWIRRQPGFGQRESL